MRLFAYIRDSNSTELIDERVRQIHRRDREEQFFLRSESVYTPAGLPVSFEVDLGPKGQGLKVRSVEALLLWVYDFRVHSIVQLRLPTDELIEITLHEK
jgi:hypothetical protein